MSDPAAGASVTVSARVEWIDTDAAGIYHNSTVARFVEAAESALMRERGLSAYFPVAPRVRYEVDFEAPLFFGQEVSTTLTVTRIGERSLTFGFEVWGEPHEGRERVRAARGSFTTVHVTGGDHAGAVGSAPWPPEWLERLR